LAVLLIFGTVVLLVSRSANGQHVEFEVAGEAKEVIFTPGRTNEERTTSFRVTVQDCHWIIKVSQLGSTREYERARWLDYETFTDGTNHCTVGYFKEKDLEEFAKSPQLTNFPKALAFIEKSKVPRGDLSVIIPVLWYGFCSKCYLDTNKGGSLEPPYNVDDDIYYYQKGITSVDAKYSRSGSFPHLPTEISFLHNGKIPNPIDKKKYPPPFDAGFTNGHFVSTGFTNISGGDIPTSLTFELRRPLPGKGPDEVTLQPYEMEFVTVTEIKERIEATDFFPKIRVNAAVNDNRFITPAFPKMDLHYQTNRMLSDEEVLSMPVYSQRKRMVPTGALPLGDKKTLALPLVHIPFLIILILAPAIFWYSSRRNIESRRGAANRH